MDWMNLLQQIFEVCIIPLLGILTTYFIVFIKNKSNELKEVTDNELYRKYIDLLQDTIVRCVIATNQTYVESLKKKNQFNKEAQIEAFNMTKQAVLAILSEEAEKYLSTIYGDLDAYIVNQIQACVNVNKIIKPEELIGVG